MRHLGGAGRGSGPFRWAALAILGGVMVLALSGLLGGSHPQRSEMRAGDDLLQVDAPDILRSGLFFELVVTVETGAGLSKPELAFSENYLRNVTVNTVMPEPAGQVFSEGAFTFEFDPLKPGDTLKVKLDAQVNPTLGGGGGDGWIELRDKGRPVARVPLDMTVLP